MATYKICIIFVVEPRIVGNAEVRPMNVGERYGKVSMGTWLNLVPFLVHNRH